MINSPLKILGLNFIVTSLALFCFPTISASENLKTPSKEVVQISQSVGDEITEFYLSDTVASEVKKIRYVEQLYAADFSNDQILVGASHNIFIGRVIAKIGNKERGIGPETQYQVEVLHSLKGDLTDYVTLNQRGGFSDGTLYVYGDEEKDTTPEDGDSEYLLTPGYTYLFATRFNETENWHTLNTYPTARKLLSKQMKTGEELSNLKNDSRVIALTDAYEKEILLSADVKQRNTLNSYKTKIEIIDATQIAPEFEVEPVQVATSTLNSPSEPVSSQ